MNTLAWKRILQPEDEYALVLTNPEDVDVVRLKRLFDQVKNVTGGRGRSFSTQATKAFEQWLNGVESPLPSQAYARLSNWFLTDATVDRESSLGERSGLFWDALFSVRPAKRLTPPKDNSQIVDIAFLSWWKRQEASQGH
jgi:hypothetical protein